MAKRQIIIDVIITVTSRSEDYIPDDTAATDSATVMIPNMEDKFIKFPNILEGAVLNVIKSHQAKVGSYLDKKAAEERKRREYAQMGLSYAANGQGPAEPDGDEDDSDMVDESDSDDADTEDEGDEAEVEGALSEGE